MEKFDDTRQEHTIFGFSYHPNPIAYYLIQACGLEGLGGPEGPGGPEEFTFYRLSGPNPSKQLHCEEL
jgi:hypothetical protein